MSSRILFGALLVLATGVGCRSTSSNAGLQDAGVVANSSAPAIKVTMNSIIDNATVADINVKLKAAGKQEIPEEVVIDFSDANTDFVGLYWDLESRVSGAGLSASLKYITDSGAEVCFTGKNKEVAANIDSITDSWLSDQFILVASALSKPDHLGVLYTDDDSGSNTTWMNIERCQ